MNERRVFEKSKYDEYVSLYKEISIKLNKPLSQSKLRFNGIPDARWMIVNCPDNTVKTWSQFVNWCGFYSPKGTNKETVIKMIYDMQNRLKRPIMYDDVRCENCGIYDIPISCINKYWGTLNKMKKELGLEIIQESMIDKHLNKDTFLYNCKILFDCADKDGIKTITREYIKSQKDIPNYECFNKASKEFFKIGFNKYIEQNGYNIGNMGNGTIYIYDDGERTTSLYEQIFSNFLRQYGLVYNKDYFRDVRYSTFTDCDSLINCDYVIYYNNKIIYIEIAGIISEYKEQYFNNVEIKSGKSKERYRLKLKEKETILNKNKLEYFILFPCDLSKDNFIQILNNPSNDLRIKIMSFNKHNINWEKINANVGIVYSSEIKWRRNCIIYDSNKEYEYA